MNTPAEDYWEGCRSILDSAARQQLAIEQASTWFAESIGRGRLVHLFGGGHSRIMVEEMWPRYGSFPGFHPIVELSLTFHNAVVGSNGQRQAMFLENRSGLAARILRNFDLAADDSALVVSSSGCNTVAIEMAQGLKEAGMRVVALLSLQHSEASRSNHPDGLKLADCVDLVLDNGAPAGDAMVHVSGLATPVSPGSTVGGCMIINALKAEVAARLTDQGTPPTVLTAANLVGAERSAELFESAYDEHGRRVARLFANLGAPHDPPDEC